MSRPQAGPGACEDPSVGPQVDVDALDDLRHRPNRLPLLGLALLAAAALAWLAVGAFQESVLYYLTPSEAQDADPEDRFRLAGMVVDDSLYRDDTGILHFEVTDGAVTVSVRFDGQAPDSLSDGAEAVAEGRMTPDGVFEADSVLARCASKFEEGFET
jgi:cytochrome c-type biogenesis protein CcmE